MLRPLILSLACLTLITCSDDSSSIDVSRLSSEAQTCLFSANAMIDIAREAVNDASSRPERRESRRVLLEGWVARLEAGEDPCSVYESIGDSATMF